MAKSVVPKEWTELDEVMSNFDHQIEIEIADRLQKEAGTWARYPGWNFNGRVWWNREEAVWQCEVWQYHVPLEIISASSPKDLMNEVSDKYGWE